MTVGTVCVCVCVSSSARHVVLLQLLGDDSGHCGLQEWGMEVGGWGGGAN